MRRQKYTFYLKNNTVENVFLYIILCSWLPLEWQATLLFSNFTLGNSKLKSNDFHNEFWFFMMSPNNDVNE